jgi:hypothetical protein
MQAKRWGSAALVVSLLSLGLFFINYKLTPAVECFHFSYQPLRDYLWFVVDMVSSSAAVPCGFYGSFFARGLGSLLTLALAVVLVSTLWQLSSKKEYEPENLIIPIFISFSFFFALTTAVGRVCLGECAAAAPRYRLLFVPAWLALYLSIAAMGKSSYRTAAGLLILTFCFLLPQLRNSSYQRNMRYYNEVKTKWKACYLEKEDAAACDKEAGMSIYQPIPSRMAQDKIDYLKQRHLNFFEDK